MRRRLGLAVALGFGFGFALLLVARPEAAMAQGCDPTQEFNELHFTIPAFTFTGIAGQSHQECHFSFDGLGEPDHALLTGHVNSSVAAEFDVNGEPFVTCPPSCFNADWSQVFEGEDVFLLFDKGVADFTVHLLANGTADFARTEFTLFYRCGQPGQPACVTAPEPASSVLLASTLGMLGLGGRFRMLRSP